MFLNKVHGYWLLIALLMWCASPCADNLSSQSRYYELSLPVDDGGTPAAEAAPVDQARQKNQQFKEQANRQSIVSGKRLALTAEENKIKQALQALLDDPRQLSPFVELQRQPEPLRGYIEKQFYSGMDSARLKTIIELYALICGEQAVPVLAEWAKQLQNPRLLQAVVNALGYLKPGPESRAIVDRLLENELQYPDLVGSALFYHVRWPDQSAMRWVIQFRNQSVAQDIRYIAFYLGALLGDTTLLQKIIQRLEQQPPAYQRYYLHLALLQLVDEQQYRQLTSNMPIDEAARQSIERQMRFQKTEEGQRAQLVNDMLASYFFEERRMALDYLIQSRDIERLQALLEGPDALKIYRRAQQEGIDLSIIQATPEQQSLEGQTPVEQHKTMYWIWFGALVLMLVFVLHKTVHRFRRHAPGADSREQGHGVLTNDI